MKSNRKIQPETFHESKEFDVERFLKERKHTSPEDLLLAIREEMEKESFFEIIGKFLLEEALNVASQIKIDFSTSPNPSVSVKVGGIQIYKKSVK